MPKVSLLEVHAKTTHYVNPLIAHFSNFIPWKLIKLELHKYFFFICPLQLFPRKYFVFVKDSSLFLLDVLEVVF